MAKNIIVFSDGTGQEGGKKNNTNIYKLFNMIEDRTSRQVAFYDPGVGTGWNKVSGNILGKGISQNIKQCYKFIFDNYEVGDQIYLFGFSRGAATIRSLSSFIHHFGILPKSRGDLINKAFDIYKKIKSNKSDEDQRHNKKAAEFISKHHNMWVKIKFIGCFDTVAALGLPSKTLSSILNFFPGFRHKFQNFRLSESVENAYQALAIDDKRKTFHPILWDTKLKDYQTMKQVWFCGMHTDVGGGYEEQELSDIPLVWLTQMAVEQGLWIYPKYQVEINENANGHMHDSRKKGYAKLFRKQVRSWDSDRDDKPVVHKSVLERTKDKDNENGKYKPWILSCDYEIEAWKRYNEQDWSVK